LPISVLRETDAAGLGDSFQSRGNIDPIAHQIAVALLDDIAKMNPDPELNPSFRREASIALDHPVLDLDGAAHGIDHAAKLNDAPIAGALHHAPAMDGDGRIDQITAERSQPRQAQRLCAGGDCADRDARWFSARL
jgi:hypothetical protein